MLELISTLSVALVAVTVGLRLVSGSVGLQVALTVLILAPEAYLPMRTLGARFHAAADGLPAVGRVQEILESPLPPAGTRTDLAVLPSIRLAGVSVDFGDGRGLAPLDLTLPAGSITVVQGPSGVGKTTLLSLVAGLLTPDAGRVCVSTLDGGPAIDNWVDLADVRPDLWRAGVAWCGQRPVLVPGTIAQNLALGGPLDPDRQASALEAVAAQSFLRLLPAGLDTVLGDDGAGLSAGQLHRIALARALAGTAAVVLLDEPTADLDPDTEELVVTGLRELLAGRTVLISTHRPAPLRLADAVLVLGAPADVPRVAVAGLAVVGPRSRRWR